MLLKLDFLPFQHRLRISRQGESTVVFDPIRKKNIALTPEELLRQLVLHYLLEEMKYPANKIRVEIGVTLNGMPKRCDILVFDGQIKPWLIIECKSPKIKLTQSAFEQIARYNLPLKAPYIVVTNGPATYCCALDFEASKVVYLEHLPAYGG